jgi:hypothetical protein
MDFVAKTRVDLPISLADECRIAQHNLDLFEQPCIGQACLGSALFLRRCPVQRKYPESMYRRSRHISRGAEALDAERFQSGG